MSLTDLIFGAKVQATVGVVQFDCTPDENHTDEVDITDHPVEIGADTSDHIRKKPASLELNGIVTSTPVVFLASVLAPSPLTTDLIPADDRVGTAYDELRRLQEDGELVTVVTGLRTYQNMAVKSVQAKRDASTGQILDVIVSLREVLISSSLAVSLPVPADVANKAAANKGKQSKTPPSDAQSADVSSAASLLGLG